MESDFHSVPFAAAPTPDAPVPLVVDLDDTLLATDSLYEGLLNALRSHPARLLKIPFMLRRGRHILKNGLLDTAEHMALYPLNSAVLSLVQEAAASGREVWLATASPLPVAEAIAGRLGIFHGILSSTDAVNLKGRAKARALVERFGKQDFDYIGDSTSDIPVWAQARKAYVYGSSRLYAKAHEVNSQALRIPKETHYRATLRELRIWQWVKNLLVFLPLFLSHDFTLEAWGLSLLAFIALSLCASATYVINDMADLANDRVHPVKRTRPLAAGTLSVKSGMLLVLACLCAAIGIGSCLGFAASCLLAGYFLVTLSYSFVFKKILILDVIVLAVLYDLRVILGSVVIGAPLSTWLLSFLLLLFFGLALMKRSGDLEVEGGRLSGRAYIARDLPALLMMQTASGFSAVAIFCSYINSLTAQSLYSRSDWLWLAVPTLLCWYGCLILKAGRGEVRGDPLLFALKAPFTWAAVAVVAICFFLAL